MYPSQYMIYHVNQGESIYNIAERFQISVEQIMFINHLKNAVLFVGQPLYIPFIPSMQFTRESDYRQQYLPVTAYTVTMPVIVNGTDINKPPYQALNYKPQGANYPYIYVPIAQFSQVGANVKWDETTQTLTVDTDYFDLKLRLDACHQALRASRLAYQEIRTATDTEATKGKARFNGKVDGNFVFDGTWWAPNVADANAFTVGKYYSYEIEGAAGSSYLSITNDKGEANSFRRSNVSFGMETQ